MASGAAFGMMEGAYFVSRGDLLEWINGLLCLDYTKVEETCNAAAITQVMDILYPGKVALSKINYNAMLEYERVANFKILQAVFDKQKIDKVIDVPRLIKGRYQDNLEFLQWTKRFFELNDPGREYDAVGRRAQAKCVYKGDGQPRQKSNNNDSVSAAPRSAATTQAAPRATTKRATTSASASAMASPRAVSTVAKEDSVSNAKSTPAARSTTTGSSSRLATGPVARSSPTASPAPAKQSAEAAARIKDLTTQVADLELTRDGLEKERDFYFGRLREIELYLQNLDQENPVVKAVSQILYNPAEEDGVDSQANPIAEE